MHEYGGRTQETDRQTDAVIMLPKWLCGRIAESKCRKLSVQSAEDGGVVSPMGECRQSVLRCMATYVKSTTTTFVLVYWRLCTVCGSSGVELEPTFDVPIVNVTVVRGQIALLPCSIDFLGKYKVTRSLLSVHYSLPQQEL